MLVLLVGLSPLLIYGRVDKSSVSSVDESGKNEPVVEEVEPDFMRKATIDQNKVGRKQRGGDTNKKRRQKEKLRMKLLKLRRITKNSKRKSKKKENRQDCSSEVITEKCMQDTIEAMEYDRKQIKTFLKQKTQIERIQKTMKSKGDKAGIFNGAKEKLLKTLGCKKEALQCNKESLTEEASKTYTTLSECLESVNAACTLTEEENVDVDTGKFQTCIGKFNAIRVSSADCRTKTEVETTLGTPCNCWSDVAAEIEVAKQLKCSDVANSIKLLRTARTRCLGAFSKCKKAEDATVGLIKECSKGEVKSKAGNGTLMDKLCQS